MNGGANNVEFLRPAQKVSLGPILSARIGFPICSVYLIMRLVLTQTLDQCNRCSFTLHSVSATFIPVTFYVWDAMLQCRASLVP
jgi:hypothetical protein